MGIMPPVPPHSPSGDGYRRFELIARHTRDVVLFIRRADGRIIEVNAAAEAAYGYSRAELLAMDITRLRAPGTVGLTPQQMAQADAGGLLFETEHRRKDGFLFPVEVSSQGATVDGERMLVSVVRDITDRKRAEEALRRSEAQLRDVVEGLAEGLVVCSEDGQLLHWNRAALAMHEVASEDEVRQRLSAFETVYTLSTLDGRELSPAEWPMPRIFRGEPVQGEELVLRRKADGWRRVFRYGGTVVRGVAGERIAVLTIGDVSERHAFLGELATERDRLAVLLGSIGDGVIAVDLERRITDLNPVAAALTGWTAAEAIGRPEAEVFRIVDERTGAPAASPIERALARGATAGMDDHTALIARDGVTRPVADSAAPIRDRDGRICGVVLVFRDQTAERRAADALRESEARLRRLAEVLPQLVWTADATGRLDYFNQRWRDYTGQAPGAEAWQPVLHPEDGPHVLALWNAAVADGRLFEVEHRLRGAGGEYRWFLRRAVRLDSPGGALRWFGTCTDIHELRTSRERLKVADRAKDEFLSVAGHELRTPLTALGLQADLLRLNLRKAGAVGPQVDRQLGLITKQVSRLDKLISLLLDVSRIDAGRVALEPAPTDLADIAREVVERFSLEAASAGVELRLDATPAPGEWDRARIDQVVTNLVGNAIKYGGGRPVDVEVAQRDGHAVVTVRDAGPGIAPEHQARIFERFERGANACVAPGFGLGLWIARNMVAAHGGELRLESRLGHGATFTVLLPRTGPRQELA